MCECDVSSYNFRHARSSIYDETHKQTNAALRHAKEQHTHTQTLIHRIRTDRLEDAEKACNKDLTLNTNWFYALLICAVLLMLPRRRRRRPPYKMNIYLLTNTRRLCDTDVRVYGFFLSASVCVCASERTFWRTCEIT